MSFGPISALDSRFKPSTYVSMSAGETRFRLASSELVEGILSQNSIFEIAFMCLPIKNGTNSGCLLAGNPCQSYFLGWGDVRVRLIYGRGPT